MDDGTVVHNPTACVAQGYTNAATTLAYLGYGATLLPAITPLNMIKYQFIYPEDIEVMAMSFNTNVEGTTVQGEIAYRPDFPLATAVGDQINQIADAAGTTLALTAFGHDTYALAPTSVLPGLTLPGIVNALAGASAISKDFSTLLKSAQRSSLPTIDSSLVKVYDATSYYRSTAFIEYDVLSLDLFNAVSRKQLHNHQGC